MKIEDTKFDIGQRVWPIQYHRTREVVPCDFCAGEGMFTGRDGSQRNCPARCSSGTTFHYTEERWHVGDGAITVGQARVQLTAEAYVDMYTPTRVDTYMCGETGVGTGTLWREDRLFATWDEAVVEAERRTTAGVRP